MRPFLLEAKSISLEKGEEKLRLCMRELAELLQKLVGMNTGGRTLTQFGLPAPSACNKSFTFLFATVIIFIYFYYSFLSTRLSKL